MQDNSVVLGTEVHHDGKVTETDSEGGKKQTEEDRGAKGDGGGQREVYIYKIGGKREEEGGRERIRGASLQMRGLEARRQFKQAWLPLRHDRLLIPHPHTLTHTLIQSRSCMLAYKTTKKS